MKINTLKTLVPADESRDMLEKYDKHWSKMKHLIRPIIIMRNLWKSNLIQMVFYFCKNAATLSNDNSC